MGSGDARDWLRMLNASFPNPKGTLKTAVVHVTKRLQERLHFQIEGHPATVDGTDLQAWFLELCTYRQPVTDRPVDLSHRRRQVLADAFNRVAEAAIKAGLLPPGTRVYNYPRQKRPLVPDLEVLLAYPLSGFLCLCRHFVHRVLFQGRAGCDDDPAWDAYFGAAFALIALGGVCWEGAFASIAHLRARHLVYLDRNVLILPQARGNESVATTKGWVRVHLTPFVTLCVASAACYRARPAVPSRRRPLVRLHPEADLLPDRRGKPGPRDGGLPVDRTRRRFNRWLERLCEEAGQPLLTVRTLARLARTHLWLDGVYPEPVLAAFLGLTPYNPVPLEELDIFEGYLHPPGAPAWDRPVADVPEPPPRRRTPAPLREPIPFPEAARSYADSIAGLQTAVRLFVRQRGTREEATAALQRFAAGQLAALGIAADGGFDALTKGLRRAYQKQVQPFLTADARGEAHLARIRPFNLAAAALYLAHLTGCTALSPLTVAARRSDLTFVLRQFPLAALTELDSTALEILLALDRAAPTRQRVRGTLRQLRRFLADQLDVPLPPLEVERWPRANVTQPVHLLSDEHVRELLAHFVQRGALMDRNGYLGVGLAAYVGLRASEVAALRIQDLVMRGGCFLEVRDSKFGKSRRVPLEDVPSGFLEGLARIRRQRWRESGSDPLAPLCVGPDGDPLSADRLSRYVVDVMAALNMRGDSATGAPVTFHRLRHGAVCRRLVQGAPPPLVARWVGHAAPGVTVEIYAHHWDWAQRECLRRYNDPRLPPAPHLTPATLGVLMDLTPQAVKAAMQRARRVGLWLRRVPAGRVEGTVWGLRRGGGSETKVIPLEDALRLVVVELKQGMG